MIESIMAKGFIAISAYMYMFALVALILFIVAIVANAFFNVLVSSYALITSSSVNVLSVVFSVSQYSPK